MSHSQEICRKCIKMETKMFPRKKTFRHESSFSTLETDRKNIYVYVHIIPILLLLEKVMRCIWKLRKKLVEPKGALFMVISHFADPKPKIQACFSQLFTNVNNIWLQSTSKTHISTYKLLFLVSRNLVSLFVKSSIVHL